MRLLFCLVFLSFFSMACSATGSSYNRTYVISKSQETAVEGEVPESSEEDIEVLEEETHL